MKRIRLLDLMCSRYREDEREHLMAKIVCRDVLVDGEVVADPKQQVPEVAQITVREQGFVSRGGVKLQHALEQWSIQTAGHVFLDAGSSTGGFTDCLLRAGAAHVYAVDVGYNQLDYSLRRDPRVTVMEKTNIMDVQDLDPVPDAAVADLSFRSITGAADHILSIIEKPLLIALIKPQFERAHRLEDFTGIVRDRSDRHRILREIFEYLRQEQVALAGLTASPIPGRKGNQEYLALLTRAGNPLYTILSSSQIEDLLSKLP
jgi:23S rRNA (cytidine1920-2'-O)/16S rRNA (cytidine1409-2'-O)-methyltransferase